MNIKTEGVLQKRAITCVRWTAIALMVLFALGGIWISQAIDGYVLTVPMAHDGPSNPLYKQVGIAAQAWFANYREFPITMLVPFVGFLGALISILTVKRYPALTFIASACSVAGVIATVGISMFPFILPSSTNPGHSLVVWDSSSSQTTLMIMLVATVLLLPIVLLYTAWVYRVLRGKITLKTLTQLDDVAY